MLSFQSSSQTVPREEPLEIASVDSRFARCLGNVAGVALDELCQEFPFRAARRETRLRPLLVGLAPSSPLAIASLVADLRRQGARGDLSGLGEDERALDRVSQLADVAWVVMPLQERRCLAAEMALAPFSRLEL